MKSMRGEKIKEFFLMKHPLLFKIELSMKQLLVFVLSLEEDLFTQMTRVFERIKRFSINLVKRLITTSL